MQYFVSKSFEKQFKKLPKKIKQQAIVRLQLFVADPMNYHLRNHPLTGEWLGYRSIDVTGDTRAVYKKVDEHVARFVAIGSHSKLYE